MLREILNFEVRLYTGWDNQYGQTTWEVVLAWKDHALRRWTIDEGQYHLFTEKPHQRDEFIAERLAEMFGASAERVTYDHDTLDKVVTALREVDLADAQITDAINAMQNQGILFRERVRD